MKGQEERDNFFGRVFGLASVLQSGRCYGKDADAEVVGQIVTQLIDLSTRKSYLREPALQVGGYVPSIVSMPHYCFKG